jgi:hypothetical protein
MSGLLKIFAPSEGLPDQGQDGTESSFLILRVDHAPGHDPEFASSLINKFPFIREKFLPANTKSFYPLYGP